MKKFAGKIDLILGPMFAGKTTQLIKRIKDYEKEKKTCLVLNHTLDSRYSSESFLISHNNDKIPAIKINKIEEIISNKLYEQFDVVGIDEGQFFSDISIGAEILANEGKIVIVSGLDGNYLRKPFADLINLIPMAECVIKLQAVCVKCNANASFTKRLKNERDEVLVGDQQIYIPLCRKCYFGYKVQ